MVVRQAFADPLPGSSPAVPPSTSRCSAAATVQLVIYCPLWRCYVMGSKHDIFILLAVRGEFRKNCEMWCASNACMHQDFPPVLDTRMKVVLNHSSRRTLPPFASCLCFLCSFRCFAVPLELLSTSGISSCSHGYISQSTCTESFKLT